jgi:hypothetical protein
LRQSRVSTRLFCWRCADRIVSSDAAGLQRTDFANGYIL